MGHGVRSALVTAMIRALLQELCFRAKDPADLLRSLNSELIGILKHAELGMFATAMYMTVDVERGVMQYSIAGHAAPLHLRRAKGLAEAPGSAKGGLGPALGLFPTAKYQNRERSLETGDAIVLFTDGLYEAEDDRGRLFGRDRLMNVIAKNVWMPLDDILNAVIGEVESYAGGDFGDDVCLLGVEIRRIMGKQQVP
jgi:serine phosphatase RsbU (regulator of sigma subunit)